MSAAAFLILLAQLSLSILLGGVFLAAALPKLRHPKGFLLTVLDYRILPDGASRLYARVVPPIELLAALLLLTGVAPRPTALLLALLTLSFLVGVAVNVARGRDLDCGCFGKNRSPTRRVGPGLLLWDAGLLAAALILAGITPGLLEGAPWSLARLTGAPIAGPLVVAACGALTVAVTVALARAGPRVGRNRLGLRVRMARHEAGSL